MVVMAVTSLFLSGPGIDMPKGAKALFSVPMEGMRK